MKSGAGAGYAPAISGFLGRWVEFATLPRARFIVCQPQDWISTNVLAGSAYAYYYLLSHLSYL